jgi:hypothetical protein
VSADPSTGLMLPIKRQRVHGMLPGGLPPIQARNVALPGEQPITEAMMVGVTNKHLVIQALAGCCKTGGS